MKKLVFLIIWVLTFNILADPPLDLPELIDYAKKGNCNGVLSEIGSSPHVNSYGLYMDLLNNAFQNCEKESTSLPKEVQIARNHMLNVCESKICEHRDFAGGGSIFADCTLEVAECKYIVLKQLFLC